MTPERFVNKWQSNTCSERAAAQEHFNDLCKVLNEPTPNDADPDGKWYAFEKGVNKSTGARGWADVWKANHFAWEYKRQGRDLNAAFTQLQQYAGALGNPPLLVVSDMQHFRIHTAWTNTVTKVTELSLDDLLAPSNRDILKWVLSKPERLRPDRTRQMLTEDAAERFAALARNLRARGFAPHRVAHFVNRLVFCMFAEDVELLPEKLFKRMLEASIDNPKHFLRMARQLFAAMRSGGLVGFEEVQWFNGGLFNDDDALPLERDDIKLVLSAAELDWADIDPSIFGTLFERGLDPDKRSQLGAHYTDRDKIMRIIEPVVKRPLEVEWSDVKVKIQKALNKAAKAKDKSAQTKAWNAAEAVYRTFLDRLRAFRVLDPACGSGNFLYLALLTLKDLEHRVSVEAEAMGLPREFPQIGPECVMGIEINPYAAELARVSVWIGEIQWMRRNGLRVKRQPVLRALETIENRDALFPADPSAPWPDAAHLWPKADVVIGNPPFLGDKLMLSCLGEDYVGRLRKGYANWLPGSSDLVCYWFAVADQMLRERRARCVGLVATNSIRGGANRVTLERMRERHVIFDAWDDEEWAVEGAAVRVSLVCFAASSESAASGVRLNGREVGEVFADLTCGTTNLTRAEKIAENKGIAFQGPVKVGAFDIPGKIAREWLRLPTNPNGRRNVDVLRPWANGIDIVRRWSDTWIIDFGHIEEATASFYEAPFFYALQHIKPKRDNNRDANRRTNWWRLGRSGADLKDAVAKLPRYIATPRVAKYRLFAWLEHHIIPDSAVVVIARDDDTTFGVLHSRFHEAWSLRLCTWLGVGNDPRYTPSTTFETFPFPEGLTPNLSAPAYADDPRAMAIAAAARRLDEQRRNWLNPSDLVDIVPEAVPGFPDRILPKNAEAATILAKRTLTNLYNERPRWLANAHAELDAAVAAAYGWPTNIDEDDALARLLELNLSRSR